MFKKIKKHRLSLFLLALVAMLSVYYVMMPTADDTSLVGGEGESEVRYQEFAELRLEILSDRKSQVAIYEAKITETTTSIKEVEACLLEIETITSLTENEVNFEKTVINLGYEDSLVFLSGTDLNIMVLTEEKYTNEKFVEIALLGKEMFGTDVYVSVNFVNPSS